MTAWNREPVRRRGVAFVDEAMILVVEDDASLRTMIVHLVRHAGFKTVVACADVETAIQHGQRVDFDVVLVDVHLAGSDGLDVVRAVKSLHRRAHPAVVVMTGDAQSSVVRRAWRAGAEDVMIKPFDPASLADRLRVLLTLRGGVHDPHGVGRGREGSGREGSNREGKRTLHNISQAR